MKKIIFLSLLLLIITILPAVAHADASENSAANAVVALLQNNGLSVAGSNTNNQSMSACVALPNCYNGLVGIAKTYNVTVDGVSGDSPLKTVPAVKTTAKPETLPKMFWIPKIPNGNFNIEKIPEDILSYGQLLPLLTQLFWALAMFGFVYNMYMQLHRLTTGQESQNKSYFQLFMQVFWAIVAFIFWKNDIFFAQYLTAIDTLQTYIVQNLTLSSMGAGVLTAIGKMINFVHAGKGSGFVIYEPWTWPKAGNLVGVVIEELVLSLILFLIYALYVVIFFVIYLFQILILGLLFAIFPIAAALNVGEYASKYNILSNWFKWWFEVSSWGFFLLFENVIFNITVGNYLANAGFINSWSGFSTIVAIGLLIVMILMLLAGPFLIHKIFGMTAGHGHLEHVKTQTQKIARAVTTGGASVPADAPKKDKQQADGSSGGGQTKSSEQSQTYGSVAGGVAPGVSSYKPKKQD